MQRRIVSLKRVLQGDLVVGIVLEVQNKSETTFVCWTRRSLLRPPEDDPLISVLQILPVFCWKVGLPGVWVGSNN